MHEIKALKWSHYILMILIYSKAHLPSSEM